ncbi:hypothetical protein [Glycomyces rhizosphaerae]|uniref:Uncharacterized protein n=1 Tax=Glycomyces rhizosphaerae TaxID=2054422 RepID=A0ABV7Q8L0_9ACTN
MTWLQALWKATLIVVAVGVALMHSTGHACTDDICHSETSAVAAFDTHAAAEDGEGVNHHGRPFGSDMNPMQVCMAILTGLALAVSLWAIWRLARLVANGLSAMHVGCAIRDAPISPPPRRNMSHVALSVFRI